MADALVLNFGPRKRPVCVSPAVRRGLRKRICGVDCNGVAAAELTLVARRNNSLSSGGEFLVFGSVAMGALAISLGFALNGAWLVSPFARLDILVVYLAFQYVERRAAVARWLKEHLKIR